MAKIAIQLCGKNLTTESLYYFRQAIDAAAGHSGEDFPMIVRENQIHVIVDAEEK